MNPKQFRITLKANGRIAVGAWRPWSEVFDALFVVVNTGVNFEVEFK